MEYAQSASAADRLWALREMFGRGEILKLGSGGPEGWSRWESTLEGLGHQGGGYVIGGREVAN